jgi:hypothetical protein
MRNLPKILGSALAVALSCSAAMPADEPGQQSWKAGWDRKQIKVFAYACTDGLVESATSDYNAAARASGVTIHKPFPEQAFRDSAFPMCLCVSERVAATWTLAEMEKLGMKSTKPMIDEALSGGQCKPGGMLGDIIEKRQKGK